MWSQTSDFNILFVITGVQCFVKIVKVILTSLKIFVPSGLKKEVDCAIAAVRS